MPTKKTKNIIMVDHYHKTPNYELKEIPDPPLDFFCKESLS